MSDFRLHFELPASNIALGFCPAAAAATVAGEAAEAAAVSELIKLSAKDVHTATNEKRYTHTHTEQSPTH